MPDLQRLVYVSRARLPLAGTAGSIHPEVGRILRQSRRNNPRRGLVGALFFRDECFFQCLEGESSELDRLLETLRADERHHDLKVLSRGPVAQLSFERWSMKYVPDAREVQKLLTRHGQTLFDPYRFEPALINSLVAFLVRGPDAPIEAAVAPAARSIESRVRIALGMSTLAVALAVVALVLPLLR